MANLQIQPAGYRPKRGFGKHKTTSLRIDMTPMVDLGFLLISFFIFTSALNDPNVIPLFMPDDNGAPQPTAESGALSILAAKDGQLYYYEGLPPEVNKDFKSASLPEIRDVIMRKKQQVVGSYRGDADCEAKAAAAHRPSGDCAQKKLTILIKPTDQTDYKTIVALLDEMTINRIARYALVTPTPSDLDFLGTIP